MQRPAAEAGWQLPLNCWRLGVSAVALLVAAARSLVAGGRLLRVGWEAEGWTSCAATWCAPEAAFVDVAPLPSLELLVATCTSAAAALPPVSQMKAVSIITLLMFPENVPLLSSLRTCWYRA